MMSLKISTRFILVQTRHNGNVGAAARALKTMGFDDLCVVDPCDPKVLHRSKTIQGASGALDVLQNGKVYETIEDALHGFAFKCATGMPISMALDRPEQTYAAPRKYFKEILGDDSKIPMSIAFVFGNEKVGLQENHIDACDVVLGIPTNPQFGSLNLASAVQLIAYDWREALGGY